MRIRKSFVFGVKYLMVGWGFEKSSIWADPDDATVRVGDDLVAVASVHGKELTVTYGAEWEDYLKHSDYPEFKKIVDTLGNQLTNDNVPTKGAGKTAGKKAGKGKGSSW